jgi:tetratricopeptide (TPR) repeat protein
MTHPDTILNILPKIATHPLAIVAYVLVVAALLFYHLRRRQSVTFLKALDSMPLEQRFDFAKHSGYRYDDLASLRQKDRLKIIRQKSWMIFIVAMFVAALFFVLAAIVCLHNYSDLSAKYGQLNALYQDLQTAATQFRLQVEDVKASSETAAQYVDDPELRRMANDLKTAADEFDKNYRSEITVEMSQQLEIMKATVANVEGRYRDAEKIVSDSALENATQQLENMYLIRADAAFGLGEYQEALSFYQAVLGLSPDSIRGLCGVSGCADMLGEHKVAVLMDSQLILAAQYSKAAIKWIILSKAYNDRGMAYRKLGQFTNSVTDITKSIEIAERNDTNGFDLANKLWLLFQNRGTVYSYFSLDAAALSDFSHALLLLKSYKQTSDYPATTALALISVNRALCYIRLDEYSNALTDLRFSVSFFERSCEEHQEYSNYLAMALMNRGMALCDIGQYGESLNDLNRAKIIINNLSDGGSFDARLESAQVLLNEANAYSDESRANDSISSYTQAIAVLKGLGEEGHSELADAIAEALKGRAEVYFDSGRIVDAKADCDDAVKILQSLVDDGRFDVSDVLAECFELIGLVDNELSRLDDAIANYNQSMGLWREHMNLGHPEDANALATVLANRGAAYVQLGRATNAIVDCNQALELLKPFDLPSPGSALAPILAYSTRGNAFLGSGEESRAIADFESAIRLWRSSGDRSFQEIFNISVVFSNLAATYGRLNMPTNALRDVRTSIDLLTPVVSYGGPPAALYLGIDYFDQGIVYGNLRENTNAVESYQQAIQLLGPLVAAGDSRACFQN